MTCFGYKQDGGMPMVINLLQYMKEVPGIPKSFESFMAVPSVYKSDSVASIYTTAEATAALNPGGVRYGGVQFLFSVFNHQKSDNQQVPHLWIHSLVHQRGTSSRISKMAFALPSDQGRSQRQLHDGVGAASTHHVPTPRHHKHPRPR